MAPAGGTAQNFDNIIINNGSRWVGAVFTAGRITDCAKNHSCFIIYLSFTIVCVRILNEEVCPPLSAHKKLYS